MTLSLLPALRRALALSILILLVLLAWLVVAQPLIDLVVDRQNEIIALADRLERLKAAIARLPELARRDAQNRQRLDSAGGIWTGTGDSQVAADMQDRLRQVVDGNAGVVKSASLLQGAEQDGLFTVRVRLTIEGTLQTIERTLAAIETAKPAMFVDGMTITSPATFPRDKPPVLALDIEVVGYMRKTEQ